MPLPNAYTPPIPQWIPAPARYKPNQLTAGILGRGFDSNDTGIVGYFTNVNTRIVSLDQTPSAGGWYRVDNQYSIDSTQCANAIFVIRSDGSLYGKGDNASRQIQTYNTTDVSDWQLIHPGPFVRCTATAYCILAIHEDGTLWVQGTHTSGTTGLGLTSGFTTGMVQVGNALWKNISGGNTHVVGIQQDNTLWSWGLNTSGATGVGLTSGVTSTPTKIEVKDDWVRIYVGESNSLARDSADQWWGWGSNLQGSLGTGTSAVISTPTYIANGLGGDFTVVSLKSGNGIGVRPDGSLWVTGGTSTNSPATTVFTRRLPTRSNFVDAFAMYSGGFALDADGYLFAAGTLNNITGIGVTFSGFSDTPIARFPAGSRFATLSGTPSDIVVPIKLPGTGGAAPQKPRLHFHTASEITFTDFARSGSNIMTMGTTLVPNAAAASPDTIVYPHGTGTTIAVAKERRYWRLVTPPGANVWSTACWTGTEFIICGGTKCAASPDGLDWTLRTSSAGFTFATGVPTGTGASLVTNGSILLTGTSTGAIARSTDWGATWTTHAMPGGQAIAWLASAGLFIRTFAGQSNYHTSPDGITWTSHSRAVGTNIYHVVSSPSRALASGSGRLWYTDDGVNWSVANTPGHPSVYTQLLLYRDGFFYAVVGSPPRLYLSADGANFERMPLPSNLGVNTTIYNIM